MIELKQLTKHFEKFTALKNVDLKIETGTAFGLLGSNGAGKSTIMRLLSGIYRADSGEALIDGENVYDNVAVKQRVFFIDDETVQFSGYTLNKLKEYYKSYYPQFSDEIFDKLRRKLSLPLDKKIGNFSKGMKRQAIVIIGLASCTDYLFLDETFDGLDPTMRVIVKSMLVDAILDRKVTAIISSHNLREINELCDHAALLHNGRLVLSQDIDSLKGEFHKMQLVFRPDENGKEVEYTRDDIESIGIDVLHFEKTQRVYRIVAKGDEEILKAAFAAKRPLVLDVIPLTLEEVFIYELEVLGYDCSEINN